MRREGLSGNSACSPFADIVLLYQVGSSECDTSCQHVQVILFPSASTLLCAVVVSVPYFKCRLGQVQIGLTIPGTAT